MARAIIRARAADARRVAQTDKAAGGSMEHCRGMARTAVAGVVVTVGVAEAEKEAGAGAAVPVGCSILILFRSG